MGITKCTDAIEEISDVAAKEFGNETLMSQMKEEWIPLAFNTKEHKDTYILDGESAELI